MGVEVRRRRALGAQAVAGARLQQAEAVGLGSPQHQASEARAEVEAQHQQAAVEEAQHQRAWVEEAVAGRHHQAAEAAEAAAQHPQAWEAAEAAGRHHQAAEAPRPAAAAQAVREVPRSPDRRCPPRPRCSASARRR